MAVAISVSIKPSSTSQLDSRLLVNGQISFGIDSFTLGAETPVNITSSTGGAGVGKVSFAPMTMTKAAGPESSFLHMALCAGYHVEEVSLEVRQNTGKAAKSGEPFYIIRLRTVVVSSFQLTSSDTTPQEVWTLDYGAIQIAYHPMDKTGKLDKPFISSWSRITNTSGFKD